MFNFLNLDELTRSYMVAEIDEATQTNSIYFSTRFNNDGNQQWISLLREAAEKYNEHWLAYQIESRGLMHGFEGARKPTGGYTVKHVPHTASETLADGQFNRYYIIGLCVRAKEEGKTHVVVYRAKERFGHRPESDAIIGTKLSVDQLLVELRDKQSSLRSPLLKLNSGLSVKLE